MKGTCIPLWWLERWICVQGKNRDNNNKIRMRPIFNDSFCPDQSKNNLANIKKFPVLKISRTDQQNAEGWKKHNYDYDWRIWYNAKINIDFRSPLFELDTSIQRNTLWLDNLIRSKCIYLVVYLANFLMSQQ